MKNKLSTYRLISLCLSFLCLAGCVNEYSSGKFNHPLILVWKSRRPDDLKSVRLWVFDRNKILVSERQLSIEEARTTNIVLPEAHYTLVSAAFPAAHYTCESVIGRTHLSELVITVDEPGSNPPHIQSAVTEITPSSKQVDMLKSRILSELKLSLKNMPAEVAKVRAEVLNSAHGFHLGTAEPTSRNTTIHLGEIAPDTEGNVRFPLIRLMPVTNNAVSRAELVPTQMLITVTTVKGEVTEFNMVAPNLGGDDYYDLEADYKLFKEGKVIEATIKDWNPGNNWGEDGNAR